VISRKTIILITIGFRISNLTVPVAYPGIFFQGGGSTNSVEERWQREWGYGGICPLVRGATQLANE
jgi:hypothetical protein